MLVSRAVRASSGSSRVTSAIVYPVLGDWAVTLWLVLGFLAMIGAMLWALPELRKPVGVALLLLCPMMVEAPLLGQLPFEWATAMLFVAVGSWRRERFVLAAVALGLAQATHAPLIMPLAVVFLSIALLWRNAAVRDAPVTAGEPATGARAAVLQ